MDPDAALPEEGKHDRLKSAFQMEGQNHKEKRKIQRKVFWIYFFEVNFDSVCFVPVVNNMKKKECGSDSILLGSDGVGICIPSNAAFQKASIHLSPLFQPKVSRAKKEIRL